MEQRERTVRDEAAEVAANNAVPGSALSLVKLRAKSVRLLHDRKTATHLSLNVLRNILCSVSCVLSDEMTR